MNMRYTIKNRRTNNYVYIYISLNEWSCIYSLEYTHMNMYLFIYIYIYIYINLFIYYIKYNLIYNFHNDSNWKFNFPPTFFFKVTIKILDASDNFDYSPSGRAKGRLRFIRWINPYSTEQKYTVGPEKEVRSGPFFSIPENEVKCLYIRFQFPRNGPY